MDPCICILHSLVLNPCNLLQLNNYTATKAEINVTLRLTNADQVSNNPVVSKHHTCVLLIGDTDNRVIFKARVRYVPPKLCVFSGQLLFKSWILSWASYSDAQLMRNETWVRKVEVKRALKGEELSVNLISQDWGENENCCLQIRI